MKAERLFRALGLVDPALVEEARTSTRRGFWKRWGMLAACLALACALGVGSGLLDGMGGSSGGDSMSGGAAPADSGNSGGESGGVENGVAFLSYAGPVFPLATAEDPAGLTAERETTWDFAPGAYADGEARQWGASVADAYVLTNLADTDVSVTALYPFAGTLDSLGEALPAVTVDGVAAESTLYAGAYSGGFQSTFGAERPDTMNLDALNSWEKYKALLDSGEYLAQALGEYPILDIPVTVYEFSDFAAPLEEYRAATQAVDFIVGESATQVLTYGFNGMDWDGNFRRYSYFVPDGVRNEPDLKLLVVLGEDIGDYTLRGYQDGGCNPGEEIEGVSCTVTRSETTLDAVLDRLCRYYRDRYYIRDRAIDQRDAFDEVPFEIYRGAVAELLAQYGVLSGDPMDRYAGGRLDDILGEALGQDRMLYLAFPVTVPAGGSVWVECGFWKAPSFDYGCSGSENAGLQGYDLVTRLGSTLEFTSQRAALVNTGGVEVTGQNFGFDLENGITAVDLDLGQEHYYLEIHPEGE